MTEGIQILRADGHDVFTEAEETLGLFEILAFGVLLPVLEELDKGGLDLRVNFCVGGDQALGLVFRVQGLLHLKG